MQIDSGDPVSKRKTYREKRESALGELDTKLAKLRQTVSGLTQGARQDLDGGMEALTRKRKRFVEKVSALRGASGEAWDELRTGVDNSWDELEDAYSDLRKGINSALGRMNEGSRS